VEPFKDKQPEARAIHRKFDSRITKMRISPTNSGFKNWSKDHRSSNDNDDNTGGATPIAIRKPSAYEEEFEEAQHRPWSIPGVGGAF
jgi:hypothetical protein